MAKSKTNSTTKNKGGRPPTPETTRQMLSVRLSPRVVHYLRTTSNVTATVEQLVVQSEGFIEWLKNRQQIFKSVY